LQDQAQHPPKNNTGLIIGVVIGAVLFVAAIVVGGLLLWNSFSTNPYEPYGVQSSPAPNTGILNTPAPAPPTPVPSDPANADSQMPITQASPNPDDDPTPPSVLVSDHEIVGIWEFESGDPVYFFDRSEYIMFIEYEDGTFLVYEADLEEWGTAFIDERGILIVDGEISGEHEFIFSIENDRLTLIDSDNDEIHYIRFG